MAGRSVQLDLLGTFVCFALLVCCGNGAHLQEAQNRIFERLFNSSSSKWLHTFPICDPDNLPNMTFTDYLQSTNKSLLNVQLMIYFNQLSGLDEKQQSVEAKFSFVMKWRDCRLRWKAAEYANIRQIVMNTRDARIFIPALSLDERLEDDIVWSESAITIFHDGYVTLQKTDSLLFGCNVDVKMYPFDSQECNATFRSRTYGLEMLNLTMVDTGGSEKGHLDSYIDSDTWTLVSQSCESSKYSTEVDAGTVTISDSSQEVQIRKEDFAQVVFRFTLQRQPFYEVVNLILPAVVTVIISGSVFFIPPGVTDKVGLSLTILLGMFVFTQLMYDKMPETGSQLPLLSQYFLICIGMICGSCILCVFTSNMSERREVCMHPTVHRVFLQWIGPRLRPDLFRTARQRRDHRVRLVAHLRNADAAAEVNMKTEQVALESAEEREQEVIKHVEDEEVTFENVGDVMRNEWLLLSQVCDRVFLIIHMSVTLLLFVMFTAAGLIHMFA